MAKRTKQLQYQARQFSDAAIQLRDALRLKDLAYAIIIRDRLITMTLEQFDEVCRELGKEEK